MTEPGVALGLGMGLELTVPPDHTDGLRQTTPSESLPVILALLAPWGNVGGKD